MASLILIFQFDTQIQCLFHLVFVCDLLQFHRTKAAEGIVHRSAHHSRVSVFCTAAEPRPVLVVEGIACNLVAPDHRVDEPDYVKAALNICSFQH